MSIDPYLNKTLVIIPARGGSKGIPRKNLRTLFGKPLIYYSINNALNSKYKPDVFVSTDDSEIASIAKKLGAQIIERDPKNAEDHVTLDPVIIDAYFKAMNITARKYDVIVTMQPTSPLLKVASLDSAIDKFFADDSIDTIISAKNDTHLSWRLEGDKYVPNYEKRVNRQYLTPSYTETGAFVLSRPQSLAKGVRIDGKVDLFVLDKGQDIDIDDLLDWNMCDFFLKKKKVLFVVSGNQQIGLGHVYNMLILANEILEHEIEFLVDSKSQLAFDKISSKNYKVSLQKKEDLLEAITSLNPDVVINDCLDTSSDYMAKLKEAGMRTINFEDLGDGARFADVVFNAIYPESNKLSNHYFGHEYYLLRDEFCFSTPLALRERVKNVLITFGGVDPNNCTLKVVQAIYDICKNENIEIHVVSGFGYSQVETLLDFEDLKIHRDVSNISEFMREADIIFTSAGRTLYEIAHLQVPAIVIAQNEREMTHFFGNEEYGFSHLGLAPSVSLGKIQEAFLNLVNSRDQRLLARDKMSKVNLMKSKKNTVRIIKNFLGELDHEPS